MRLLGICLASFSSGTFIVLSEQSEFMVTTSGLGELTYLQLSTTYAPQSVAGHSVGYVAFYLQ